MVCTMVKFGEFSPLNPDLQCTDKSLLGLGEYEEKRRILLEKKKREFQEQMVQAKALQKTKALTGNNCRARREINLMDAVVHEIQRDYNSDTDVHLESETTRSSPLCEQTEISADGDCLPFVSTPQEMNHLEVSRERLSLPPLSPGAVSISARDRKMADLRQSLSETLINPTPCNDSLAALSRRSQDFYQEELRRQIEEKRRLEAEQKEREKREEEAILRRLAKQQEQMRKEFEWEEAQRKALAEKRTRKMEEAIRRHEELEREAAELRKTKWTLEKQQDANDNICMESLPVSAVRAKNLHSPVIVRSDRFKGKEKQNGYQNTDNAVLTTKKNNSRSISEGETALCLKVCGSENLSSKLVGSGILVGRNHLSPANRNFQPQDQKENNINLQFQHDRLPLKMLQNLGKDHNLEDTLPIPVFRSRSPVLPAVRNRTSLERVSRSPVPRRYSEGMQVLESKWQVPAVEKNNLQTTDRFQQVRHNNELTQLGAFRRQLQLEQLRLDEMLRQQQNVKKA